MTREVQHLPRLEELKNPERLHLSDEQIIEHYADRQLTDGRPDITDKLRKKWHKPSDMAEAMEGMEQFNVESAEQLIRNGINLFSQLPRGLKMEVTRGINQLIGVVHEIENDKEMLAVLEQGTAFHRDVLNKLDSFNLRDKLGALPTKKTALSTRLPLPEHHDPNAIIKAPDKIVKRVPILGQHGRRSDFMIACLMQAGTSGRPDQFYYKSETMLWALKRQEQNCPKDQFSGVVVEAVYAGKTLLVRVPAEEFNQDQGVISREQLTTLAARQHNLTGSIILDHDAKSDSYISYYSYENNLEQKIITLKNVTENGALMHAQVSEK